MMTAEHTTRSTLGETLAAEERTCIQCSMKVANPFIERCPRCAALLPRPDLSCRGCAFGTICPHPDPAS